MIVPDLISLHEKADSDAIMLSGGPSFGLVHLRVLFFAGAGPEEKGAGRTHLAFSMLDRGTRHRGRLDFNEALEALGAELNWSVGRSSTVLTLRVLEPELSAAIDLLAECMLETGDDAEEFAVLRREVAEDIRVSLEEPSGVGARLLGRVLWPESAWGAPIDGTAASRRGIRLPSLAAARAAVYGSRMVVGVAADHPERLQPEARRLIDAVRAHHPRRAEEAPGRPAAQWGATWACAFDGAEQASLQVASAAPAPFSAMWPAVTLHHAAFTASMNSPLTRAIRGDEGLSYDVSSVLAPDVGNAMMFFGTQPHGSRVQYVLERAEAAWDNFVATPPDEAAVADVVRHLSGTHRVGLETVRQRLAYAMQLVRLGGPLRWMTELPELLAGVDRTTFLDAPKFYGWRSPRIVLAVLPGGAQSDQWPAEPACRAIAVDSVL